MGAAEEERRAQLLAAEMAEHDHLVVALDPVEALSVIGMLQLALRHPTAPAGTSQIVVAFIDRVVHAYGLRGPGSREFARIVAEGFDPDADLDVDARRDVEPALIPPHVREAMVEIIDRPLALERLRDFGLPVVLDESLPPDVIEVRGETTTRIRGWSPPPPTQADVVRPAGLVWSGIRVDEMPRLYEVLDRSHEACPARLEDGEIVGDPATGRVWVWSLAEFNRLVEFSRALHDIARGRRLPGVTYGELTRRARELGEAGADALDIVRALPPGGID
jgi:hypothetical protein